MKFASFCGHLEQTAETLLGVHGLHVPQVCLLIELFGMWHWLKSWCVCMKLPVWERFDLWSLRILIYLYLSLLVGWLHIYNNANVGHSFLVFFNKIMFMWDLWACPVNGNHSKVLLSQTCIWNALSLVFCKWYHNTQQKHLKVLVSHFLLWLQIWTGCSVMGNLKVNMSYLHSRMPLDSIIKVVEISLILQAVFPSSKTISMHSVTEGYTSSWVLILTPC